MTKEELREEAEDYANYTRIKDKNTYISFDDERISELQDYEGNYMDISERIIKTYIDSAEPREKRITELEKENEELKDKLKDANEKVVHLACNQNKDLKYKLTKANELIKRLIKATYGEGWNYSLQVKVEAEQFLKECE